MIARLKTLSPAASCALIAAVGGLIGGSSAVYGLKQNRYGPPDPPALIGNGSSQYASAGYESDGGYRTNTAADCDGCSERDLGYRWAAMTEVRSPDQCPHDNWGLRRGCLDFTGGI